jgi:hypothetical protein
VHQHLLQLAFLQTQVPAVLQAYRVAGEVLGALQQARMAILLHMLAERVATGSALTALAALAVAHLR